MKDLSKTLVVKELINSLYLIKEQAFWLVMASLTDALFFVAWGFFTTPLKDKIVEHSILLANELSTILAGEMPTGLLGQLMGPQLRPLTWKLITLIGMLFIVIYIIYNIFHGTSWWMATKIAGQKLTYKKYMLGFARVNLIWITGYVLFKLFDVMISMRHLIIQKLAPGTPNIAGKILFIALLLLGISAFVSYPTLRARTIFKTPINITVPLIIISASMFLTTQFILNNIGKINVDAALVIGLILLFPVMNLIRVYATRVLSHVHPHT